MGLFSRDREDDAVAPAAAVQAPHPALASLATFRDAPPAEAAAAVLMFAFGPEDGPGDDVPQSTITLRAQELLGPGTGLKGGKLLQHFQDHDFGLAVTDAVAVLVRSLLVDPVDTGGSMGGNLRLTRRGHRALHSGIPLERWMDVPADPV